MAGFAWLRWLWPFGGKQRGTGIAHQDTLARRVESAVRGSRERDLLRSAEESMRRGRREEALRAYQAALEIFEDRGANLKSAAVLATLTRIEPEEPGHFEALAEIQEKLGRRPEAGASRSRAAQLRELRGENTLAHQLRHPSVKHTSTGPGLQVHPSASEKAPVGHVDVQVGIMRPVGTPEPAPIPDAVSEVGPLDLGPLEDLLPDAEPTPAAMPVPPAPFEMEPDFDEGADAATVHMPAVVRPVPEEPEMPPYEPLAPGVPPASTDPNEVFGMSTYALGAEAAADASDLPTPLGGPDNDAVTLGVGSHSPLNAEMIAAAQAQNEADREAYDDEDEEQEVGDQTLWDPGFMAVHADTPVNAVRPSAQPETRPSGPRGLSFPSRTEKASSPDGPKGLNIPDASTTFDPRGSSAARASRKKR